jgi:hypothetical protein
MAIDTRDKRQSALNFGGIGLNIEVMPNADGTVGDPDQQHQLDCYSGIAFSAPGGFQTAWAAYSNVVIQPGGIYP